MSRLDDAIANTAYILDSLVALRNIQECGCCNDCGIAKFCKMKPKVGEMVRYNCMSYVEAAKESQKQIDEKDMDVSFFIPPGYTIPTCIMLKVAGIIVECESIEHGFRFRVYTIDDVQAMEIAKRISEIMIQEQSMPDKGVKIITESIGIVQQRVHPKRFVIIDWRYRKTWN